MPPLKDPLRRGTKKMLEAISKLKLLIKAGVPFPDGSEDRIGGVKNGMKNRASGRSCVGGK